MLKNENEAWDLFVLLAENSLLQTQSAREAPSHGGNQLPKKGGIYETSPNADLIAKMDALSHQVTQMMALQLATQAPPPPHEVCNICYIGGHQAKYCPNAYQESPEQGFDVNAINSNNNPYSNSYNPGTRNHPNFSWGPQGQTQASYQAPQSSNAYQQPSAPPMHNNANFNPMRPPFQVNRPSFNAPQANYSQGPRPQFSNSGPNFGNGPSMPTPHFFQTSDPSSSKYQDQRHDVLEQQVSTLAKGFSRLEMHIGQIAQSLNRREEGTLPSQPIENPKGKDKFVEHVNAITALRGGKIVDNGVGNSRDPSDERNEVPKENVPVDPIDVPLDVPLTTPPADSHENLSPASYVPKPPYPQALKDPPSPSKKGTNLEQLMKTFEEVKVNIPLLDAIRQVPAYAKFLKDLCTQKRSRVHNQPKRVFMAEKVSAMIQNSGPLKYKDPGAPTISCVIGNHEIGRALLDLGAGVNLIPYSTYELLGLGALRPTPITLQLADRSVRMPRGIVEDVLVKIDKFIYPVDFVVLDMEVGRPSHKQVPVILGRPFLATANAMINCRSGEMKITFGNMKVNLNIFNASNKPGKLGDESEDLCTIDVINDSFALNENDFCFENSSLNDLKNSCLDEFDYKDFCEVTQFEEENSNVFENPCLNDLENMSLKEFENFCLNDFCSIDIDDDVKGVSTIHDLAHSMTTPLSISQEDIPRLNSPILEHHTLESNHILTITSASHIETPKENASLKILGKCNVILGETVNNFSRVDHFAHSLKFDHGEVNPSMHIVLICEWVNPTQKTYKGIVMKKKIVSKRKARGWHIRVGHKRFNAKTFKFMFPPPFVDYILRDLAGQACVVTLHPS